MKFKLGKITVLLLVSLMMLSGCVKEKPNILVTSYPVQFIIERLAGDRVSVERLDDNGSVAQRAQIRSDYQEALDKADVIFIINELQPYYELYSNEINEVEVVDLAAMSTLYKFARYTNVSVNAEPHYVESSYYDTPLLENVNMYTQLDPMLWMEPLAMVSMASTIKEWLVANYPEEKNFFQTNFEELEIELTALQAQYNQVISAGSDVKFVSMTPSFGNWQKSLGVGVYPVVLSEYGELPSEELFSVIRSRIETDSVRYIVHDSSLPEDYQKLYERLRIELDLNEIELSNLFSLSEDDITNQFDYTTKMRQNLQTLESLAN